MVEIWKKVFDGVYMLNRDCVLLGFFFCFYIYWDYLWYGFGWILICFKCFFFGVELFIYDFVSINGIN